MKLDIYIDALIIENVYVGWILLSLTSKITHTYIKPIKLAASSLLSLIHI